MVFVLEDRGGKQGVEERDHCGRGPVREAEGGEGGDLDPEHGVQEADRPGEGGEQVEVGGGAGEAVGEHGRVQQHHDRPLQLAGDPHRPEQPAQGPERTDGQQDGWVEVFGQYIFS